MIVCHCQVVGDSKVAAAIDAGARTPGGLCRSTGAGRSCGACVFSLKRLLCDDGNRCPPCRRRSSCSQLAPASSELFNDALTFEPSVLNTYFLHARMLDNWGFGRLGKVFYDLVHRRDRDADDIISGSFLFDGHPNVQRLGAITVGETADEMLRLALDSERSESGSSTPAPRVPRPRRPRQRRRLRGRWCATRRHADWFEGRWTPSSAWASQQYLARQIEPGGRPPQYGDAAGPRQVGGVRVGLPVEC